MKKRDVKKLYLGLYEIFWKSGGSSLAAVGNTYKVTRNSDPIIIQRT